MNTINTPTVPAWIERRRAVRNRMETADRTIEQWDDRVRQTFADVPAIEATASDIEATSTAEMTVATEWMAAMLDRVYQLGRADMEEEAALAGD